MSLSFNISYYENKPIIINRCKMNTKQLLGKRIKELIKQNGISQEKLAELIEVEPTTLSNIVTGRNYPLFSTLEKIIKILNISFSDVFVFEYHKETKELKNEIITILKKHPEKIQDIYKIAKALTE